MWVNVGVADVQWWQLTKQETQLSLTNRETRLEILTFEKYRDCDLETGVWGHWRSLEMSPFDTAHATSYWRSIVTMAQSCVVSEIFNVEKCPYLEIIRVRGHSRSLKVVPFDRLGMVSYYCPIATLSLRWLQKSCDLENLDMGPWRSLKMSPFDRAHATSYWCSIVTVAQSRVVSEIFNVGKIPWPWNPGQRSIKVIHSIDWVWFPIGVL